MPPISKPPKDIIQTSDVELFYVDSIEAQIHHARNHEDVEPAYKYERSTSPKSSLINAFGLSIGLIICAILFVCFFAISCRTRHPKRPTSVLKRIRKAKRHCQEDVRERSMSTQEVLPTRRIIHSRSRGPSMQARAATDLSQQQHHLASRLSQLQSLLEQQGRAAGALAVHTRVRTLEAAHVRDREREWEQYQLRSNQDMLSGLERMGSIIYQMQWNEEACQLGDDSQLQLSMDLPLTYFADDRAPPYTYR
ncbi:MAG: hypothetical protein Q9203_004177 [Teloschistes exilis]